MKITRNILFIALITGMSFSCSEDFLDEQPTQFITDDQIEEISQFDPSILDGFIAGVYSTMFTVNSGGSTVRRDDDLGQKGIDIYTDMLSSDVVLGGLNFGWYSEVADYSGMVDFTSNPNRIAWTYYYNVIFQANSVIGTTGDDPQTEEGRWILGQAKTMRAYGYFYLTQLYQRQFNPDEAILPIYREVGPNVAASPMSEVFQLIEEDLTSAIGLLDGYNRGAKSEVDEFVAKGLLAYNYAAQGRYDDALTLCDDIIDNGGFIPVQGDRLTGGFNQASDPGWIWGVDITANNNLSLLSWWGQMDIFSFSYSWAGDTKPIDESLFNKMRPDDARRDQFGNPSYGPYVPSQKFYNFDRTIGGSSADNNEMDYIYMRVAEFHLLAAEASMRKNSPNEGMAKSYLRNIVSLRVGDDSYLDGLNGDSLMDEILFQTRMELWGEGKSYLLMKRNDETRTRGTNHILLAGANVTHDEAKVSFIIPQAETINNPFID